MDYSAHLKRLHYLRLPEGRIAYVDDGKGPVILLVHGVPTSSWLYRKIIPELVNSGFRVVAVDLLGYGASDKPVGYDVYDEVHQGRRLLLLMKHLGIRQWTHVCHDAGGLWTWEMLKQQREDVERLILLNTIIYESGFHPPMRFEVGRWATFYTSLYKARITSPLLVGATLKNGISKQTKLSKSDLEGYIRPMRQGGNRGIYHFFTQTCNRLPDFTDLLKSLDIPTQVIWGMEDDILVWRDQAEAVQRDLQIADENVHLLNGLKHFIQEEAPEEIAGHIAAFALNEST